MVNILHEGYGFGAPWIYDDLKEYIKPEHKVAVVAFSFRDAQVKNAEDWELIFGKEKSTAYPSIVDSFAVYGIPEENISFINYFTDTKETAVEKITNSDIIFFTAGLPDRMKDRIVEFGIYEALLNHKGIAMGSSAGAVIQLADYHMSPDKDYAEFKYYKGIPYLKNFYLEVHYRNSDIQNASIKRIIKERGKRVYATAEGAGAVLVDNGNIKLIGDVKIFE